MKSKVLLSLALSMSVMGAIAQKDNVGIGTTKPDQSAVLDISSSTKGLLTPRMTLQQRNSIQSPAQGLMVYQTDMLSGFYFYDGKDWKPMTSETNANSVADANNWGLTGNAGTDAAVNFIGTSDAQALVFKAYGEQAGKINPAQDAAFYGFRAGLVNTGANNVGFGSNSLKVNVGGSGNMAIGTNSLATNVSGNDNVGVGGATLYNTKNNNNTAIGTYAGFSNASGTGNMFLGFSAGFNETGSNKLYIANSGTAQPTIYGDFSANFISIGNNITLAKRDAIATAGTYGLLVEKGILTEKLKVATLSSVDWADYVFDNNYKMMPLEDVEKFVKANKHLPNVPSAVEMSKNGLDVVTSDSKLLEKIEELTLYMIEMNKEIKLLKAENQKLKTQK